MTILLTIDEFTETTGLSLETLAHWPWPAEEIPYLIAAGWQERTCTGGRILS